MINEKQLIDTISTTSNEIVTLDEKLAAAHKRRREALVALSIIRELAHDSRDQGPVRGDSTGDQPQETT